MSNYLLICAASKYATPIAKWLFSGNCSSHDILKIAEKPINCWFIANKGKLDKTCDGGVFKGYAIDHENRRILFSGQGIYPYSANSMPGCYIRIEKNDNHLIINNDFFPFFPYYTSQLIRLRQYQIQFSYLRKYAAP